MPSYETVGDTAARSMARRLSCESNCDLYADVERGLVFQRRSEKAPAQRASNTRRDRDQTERILSPQRKPDPFQSNGGIDNARSATIQELACPRKTSFSIEATKVTIPADFEYEVAPESYHNAGQPLDPAMLRHVNVSPRLQQGKIQSAEKTYLRSLKHKSAHGGAGSASIERSAGSSTEHGHRSNIRENVSREVSGSPGEAVNAKNLTPRSRSSQRSFDIHRSEHSRKIRPEGEDLHRKTRSTHQRMSHNTRMKSHSPHPRRERTPQPDVSQSAEQHQRISPSGLADSARMSTAAGYTSRSVPKLVTTARQHTTQAHAGELHKLKGETKCKDKKENRDVKMKKDVLTTRSWRAKLAEHFGRNLNESPLMEKTQSSRPVAPIPTSIICSNDFACEILDDLTVML